MNSKAWFILLLAGLGLLAALALLQPGLWAGLVSPITLVFWLGLRVLLSVHQKLYWGLLIFAIAVYGYVRLVSALESSPDESAAPEKNNLESAEHWQAMMRLTEHEIDDGPLGRTNSLKQELASLLIAVTAAREPADAQEPLAPRHNPAGRPGTAGPPASGGLALYDAYRQGRRPLPPNVRRFLFPEDPPPGPHLWAGLQWAWQAPRRWLDQLTGRDVAAYYQMIDETLRFMEAQMEMNDDDDHAPDQPRVD